MFTVIAEDAELPSWYFLCPLEVYARYTPRGNKAYWLLAYAAGPPAVDYIIWGASMILAAVSVSTTLPVGSLLFYPMDKY